MVAPPPMPEMPPPPLGRPERATGVILIFSVAVLSITLFGVFIVNVAVKRHKLRLRTCNHLAKKI